MGINGKRRDEALLKESERVLADLMRIATTTEALIDDLKAEVSQRRAQQGREREHDA